MNPTTSGLRKPARICGPAGFLLIGIASCYAPGARAQTSTTPQTAAKPVSDHQTALAALNDIKVAIRLIIAAENDPSTGPGNFQSAAQQAINALVGHDDDAYKAVASSANGADSAGAIGNINHLLDRTASPPWVPALHGALANIGAAVARLQEAQNAKGLMRYQIAVSQSLINLEVAEGRRSEAGVLGGMKGAIANTELAVPQGARVVDGCAVPTAAPAYGVHAGYLVFRTARLGKAKADPDKANASETWTINNPGGATISARNGFLIFTLPEAARARQLCAASSTSDQSESN